MQVGDPVKPGELGLGELVGHHNHGPVPDGQEQVLDPLGGFGVQIGQGFVQKQDLCVPEQRPGQADALLFAAGEIAAVLGHRLVQGVRQP